MGEQIERRDFQDIWHSWIVWHKAIFDFYSPLSTQNLKMHNHQPKTQKPSEWEPADDERMGEKTRLFLQKYDFLHWKPIKYVFIYHKYCE